MEKLVCVERLVFLSLISQQRNLISCVLYLVVVIIFDWIFTILCLLELPIIESKFPKCQALVFKLFATYPRYF